MPFKSQKQAKWMFANKPSMAKEWASKTPSIKALPMRKKRKIKIIINNKLKGALGASDFKGKGRPTQLKPTGKIHINVKAHKGNRAELASTIKHEILHVKHPKMTEKQVYKKTSKSKISHAEQSRLISKLRMSKINKKAGSLKRKFKMGKVSTNPGDFISKMNETKRSSIINLNNPLSKRQVAIMGLV